MSNNESDAPEILKKLNKITAFSAEDARKYFKHAVLRTYHDLEINMALSPDVRAGVYPMRPEGEVEETIATTLASLLDGGAQHVVKYVKDLESEISSLRKENATLLKAKTVSELPQNVADFVAAVQDLDEASMEAKEVRRGVRKIQREAESIFPSFKAQPIHAVTYED